MEHAAPVINPLVPEFAVMDWQASLKFYTQRLGFRVLFDRTAEGFVFLEYVGAQLMFYQANLERNLVADDSGAQSELCPPLGRGVNIQIQTEAIEPILARLQRHGIGLSLMPERRWYRAGCVELGVYQFAVADPDGYLLRFSEPFGTRPVS